MACKMENVFETINNIVLFFIFSLVADMAQNG